MAKQRGRTGGVMEMSRLSPVMVIVVRLSPALLLLLDTWLLRLWRQEESWSRGRPEDTVLKGRGDLSLRIFVLGSSARLGPCSEDNKRDYKYCCLTT